MNREDIIRMAREARMPYFYHTFEIANLDGLERFANLIRAYEPVGESMIKAGLAELEAIRQTELLGDYELIKRLLEAAHGIKETEK